MDIKELWREFENCTCGKEHKCPIDAVVIGNGALDSLVKLCDSYRHVLLVSDENTYKVCGSAVSGLIGDKIENNLVFKTGKGLLIPDEGAINTIEAALTEKTELIIGIGSGVINDLCKYVSYFHDLPYFIIATAPSMDGYASVGAAMILNGMKVTVNTRPPKAIIAESDVLKNAPIDMLKAGYGDIIGKFSCLNDWELSALVNGEYFCKKIYEYTLKCAEGIKDKAKSILAREPSAVNELMEALVTVGILMSFAGSSRPASGSEHHLSHFFEITGILYGKEYFAHGIDVICSSYYTQKLREKLLSSELPTYIGELTLDDHKENLKNIYSTLTDEVIALQEKIGWYNNGKIAIYRENWQNIKAILAKAPASKEIKGYIESIGLDINAFAELYGEEKINNALLYAKDLKDRYSVLWLNFEINR